MSAYTSTANMQISMFTSAEAAKTASAIIALIAASRSASISSNAAYKPN